MNIQSQSCILLLAVAAVLSPAMAREPFRGPEAWLALMGGNVRRDGLRLDLEAIKTAGLSGVHFFHIGDRGPKGREIWPGCEATQTPCLSPGWSEIMRFLGDECARLGLELTVQNCPGWSQSGGPWIDLDHCQRDLQMVRIEMSGGERLRLPKIPGKYRDRRRTVRRGSSIERVSIRARRTPMALRVSSAR